ncbi:hypothetical protein, partial [Rhizobium leguminosarum]|uniref:hypothetical protein n=1 Tax=Rhizobium leguminosarum TaxID=384 RepID=UPI003F9C9EDC
MLSGSNIPTRKAPWIERASSDESCRKVAEFAVAVPTSNLGSAAPFGKNNKAPAVLRSGAFAYYFYGIWFRFEALPRWVLNSSVDCFIGRAR